MHLAAALTWLVLSRVPPWGGGAWWCTIRRSLAAADHGRVDEHVTRWAVIVVVVAHLFFSFSFLSFCLFLFCLFCFANGGCISSSVK